MPRRRGGLASTQYSVIVFAGSRRGIISENLSLQLTEALSRFGYRFLVGSTTGIDACFRTALKKIAPSKTTVMCVSSSRAHSTRASGLRAVHTPCNWYSIASTLHLRAIGAISRSSILVLFPDDPTTGAWGCGSQLTFNAAVQQHIPVFVVTEHPPLSTRQVRIFSTSLFGVASGYWGIPFGVAPSVRSDES